MRYLLLSACLFLNLLSNAQTFEKDEALAQANVAEGKLLYASEKASWHGTDLFLEQYKNRDNLGGYFSYPQGKSARCIFFSKAEKPVVIGTISFDENYDLKTAEVDLKERPFSTLEQDYYQLRKAGDLAIQDTFFKSYKNTQLNPVPIITENERKIYYLTGTSMQGVVLFGNDYLLRFDNNNQLLEKKRLHKNIIPTNYGKGDDGEIIAGSIHMHLPETGEFITATDVCTIMLYQPLHQWETCMIVSEKYINIWNCKSNSLIFMTREAFDKIEKDKSSQKP